ncbi:hypothetical protein EYF80_067242 [Liparis tanakae]|uniref:Uncharacterized protein n=1 Tax=Liparis tanakae TaxID=230148 RepID=A0A4Z2E2M6_9TELE|nr:hypothetical protein EYF80_067242 [Liparis tanakae]
MMQCANAAISLCQFGTESLTPALPVDAATAPMSAGGIPNVGMRNAAASRKRSIHIQARSAVREPTQGAWKVWLNDVVVMSTEAGLMRRKGTHSH